MKIEQLDQIQRQVIGHVREARLSVEATESKVNSIWADSERLTEPARRRDAEMALIEGKVSIEAVLEDAHGIVSRGFEQIDRTLVRLKDVEPEELTRRATLLSPILNQAVDRPELLINLYRERHLEPADRSLIEGTASATIDALGGSDGGQLAQQWRDLQQELALSRDPQEAEALSHRSTLEETSSYLENAQELVGADLALMDPSFSGDRGVASVARSTAEAEVNRYETEHASVLEDPAA